MLAAPIMDDEQDTAREEVEDIPLCWTDPVSLQTFTYAKNPLTYSCPFILSQELCERLAYYGLTPTLKAFIKRVLRVGDSSASSYLGIFQGTMYVTPIVSAIISDTFLGNFRTILSFSCVYALGLVMMVMAAIDEISQPWMLHVGLMVLVCVGAGGIKSCVNVFGAQQFHPVSQKDKITSFFTLFYASINAGSLVGGLICPQLAESVSYFAAYTIPLVSFVVATVVFALGRPRYLNMQPRGSPVVEFGKFLWCSLRHRSVDATKHSNGGPFEDAFVTACMSLIRLLPLCALQIPLLIAYDQMTTAFLTQGEKMRSEFFGMHMAPALMQNVDPLVVIVSSVAIEQHLYPFLRKRNMMPSVLSRFTIGNFLGMLSLLCAFGVETSLMSADPQSTSIWLQIPQFALIAIGEIFMISTGYEVAFTYAPDELKAVASACNLIFFAIAGYLSSGLFVVCSGWMPDYVASDPATYRDAHYDYYFLVLALVCSVGCFACSLFRPIFSTMKPYHSLKIETQDQPSTLPDVSMKPLRATDE